MTMPSRTKPGVGVAMEFVPGSNSSLAPVARIRFKHLGGVPVASADLPDQVRRRGLGVVSKAGRVAQQSSYRQMLRVRKIWNEFRQRIFKRQLSVLSQKQDPSGRELLTDRPDPADCGWRHWRHGLEIGFAESAGESRCAAVAYADLEAGNEPVADHLVRASSSTGAIVPPSSGPNWLWSAQPAPPTCRPSMRVGRVSCPVAPFDFASRSLHESRLGPQQTIFSNRERCENRSRAGMPFRGRYASSSCAIRGAARWETS